MFKKALVSAVTLALAANAAQASESPFPKEEGAGLITGAAVGAIVGGPIGAFAGSMIGGIIGDHVGIAKRAEKQVRTLEHQARALEEELALTRKALSRADEQNGKDTMFGALAERLRTDVLFRTGSAELDAHTAAQLAELGRLMATHPQLKVQLDGFADPRGSNEDNLKLSALRAEAVRAALIAGGVDPAQIAVSAHGEDLAVAAQDDLEAYAWERRVSLSIRPLGDSAVAQTQ